MSALVQGGVRPWWLQGSRVTWAVAPCARGPAARSASTSAWGSPARWCQPSPTTSSSRAITQPTRGLGRVLYQPRRASRTARAIRSAVSAIIFALAGFAVEAVELGAEFAQILEAAVDRGEAYEGDIVEAPQLLHDLFTDHPGGHFALAGALQVALDGADGSLHGFDAHRALFQGALQAGAQLVLVEGFTGVVALHHPGHQQFRDLEGGEALPATGAFATPTDLAAIGHQSRIDHAGIFSAAEGTVHGWRGGQDGGQSSTPPRGSGFSRRRENVRRGPLPWRAPR